MRLEQIRMYPKLRPSLDFQYHIGSRIIVSPIVLSLGWIGGRHFDFGVRKRQEK
jgi:hypothetical protein